MPRPRSRADAAATDTVAAFLAAQATAGAKASTIGRRAAAIRYAHRLAGHEPPTDAEAVKAVMRGIRRTIGAKPDQKAAATADRLTDMLACIPADTLAGKRDRALLLLGFAGAFRRSELVALTVADLIEVEGGFRVTIRRSKTDQEGRARRSPFPPVASCGPSKRSRRGWTRPASRTGRCSAPSPRAAGCCPRP